MSLVEIGQLVAGAVVSIVGPWVLKKVKDRDLREAISHTADAALVFAIHKNDKFADSGELLRAVVAGILSDPLAPKQLKNNQTLAAQAAAAAIARNSVGVAKLASE